MTPIDIIAKLFSAKGVTEPRVRKAQALALRSKLEWNDVLAAMTPTQRQEIDTPALVVHTEPTA